MQINNFNNQQTFKARTKNNNSYNRANAGKLLGAGILVGTFAEKLITKGGFKNFKQEYHNQLAEVLGRKNLLDKPILQKMANRNMRGDIIIFTLLTFGIGTAFDAIVNIQRRVKADRHHM